MNNMNKLLAFFGLTTVSRAKLVSSALHVFYVRRVVQYAENDFGVKPAEGHLEKAEEWWSREFSRLLENGLEADGVLAGLSAVRKG
jgi:hypothetical protein